MQNTQKIIFRDGPGLSAKYSLYEVRFSPGKVRLMGHQRDLSLFEIFINLGYLNSTLKLKLKLNIDTISQNSNLTCTQWWAPWAQLHHQLKLS